MRRGIRVLVVAAFAFPTLASQPGQPLDCSDWVFLEPGLSCSEIPGNPVLARVLYPGPYEGYRQYATYWSGSSPVVDPDGDILDLGYSIRSESKDRIELFKSDTSGAQVRIAYVEGRFRPDGDGVDQILPNSPCEQGMQGTPECQYLLPPRFVLDSVNGKLIVPVVSFCWGCASPQSRQWTVAISGFTPLFDVIQTYTPTPAALGFRVPAHPEGLRSADRFDTYWGHVSDLPDFTQAQPMQCHYPAIPPSVGDYLTVADTTPRPTRGKANYIVTAVSDGTQRRYGRKRIGGVMSGRDPALLPECP